MCVVILQKTYNIWFYLCEECRQTQEYNFVSFFVYGYHVNFTLFSSFRLLWFSYFIFKVKKMTGLVFWFSFSFVHTCV